MATLQQKSAFIVVLLVAFLSCAGIALPYPILAPLFIDAPTTSFNHFLNMSPEILLGVALAIYPLGVFLGGATIGALSDSQGRKKVLLVTLLISVIGYLISAYAIVSENYLLFLLSRFATGLCEGNVSIARAIALDLSENFDKTKAMSTLNAAVFSGWLFGPLAGGYLAIYGASTAFIAAAIAISLCAFVVIFVLKETKVTAAQPFTIKSMLKENSFVLLKHPILKKFFIVQFAYTLAVNAFYEFYPVWLVSAQHYAPNQIGNTTAIMTAMMTFTSLTIVARLKHRLGETLILPLSLLLMGVGFASLPLINSSWLTVSFLFCGSMIAIYNGVLPGYITDTVPDQGNGAVMGLLTSTFCLANVVIALLGSVLLTYSHSAPLLLALVLTTFASLYLIKTIKAIRPISSTANNA